jgi:CelD/BcsL family acetyltransferase involved in cellulose biosynthesis
MRSDVEVTCIEDRAQLAALEPEWDALLARTDVASPFLTPGWQAAWLDSYGAGHRLWVLAARHKGTLVGLWPLARRPHGPFRVLEPIGAGRSDWLDVPVVPDRRQDIVAAFLAYLEARRSDWDLLELRDVLADSSTIPAFTAGASGLRLRREPRTVAPYLSLDGSWEQFLGAKRPKFRSNLKYYRRLAERDGRKLDIRRVPWSADDSDAEVLATIERNSWKARDGNLKVSTPSGQEFYRRFCSYLSRRGSLELWRADIDSVPIAFVLNVVFGGKVYHYNTCYDEKFATLSPGLLLHSEAIADAFERRLTEYDFLSGDEPYKERWCSDRRAIDHLVLFHGGAMSRAAYGALVQVRWTARRSPTLTRARHALLAGVRKLARREPGPKL